MKVRLLSFVLVAAMLVLVASSSQAQSAHNRGWVTVSIANGSGHATDTMGTAIGATDCIDAAWNESELPPAPPSGIFDSRFIEPGCAPAIQGLSLDLHGGSHTPAADTAGTFIMSIQKDTTLPIFLTLSAGWTAVFPTLEIYDNPSGGTGTFDVILNTSPEQDTLTLAYSATSHGVTTVHDVTQPAILYTAHVLGVPVKTNDLVPAHFALGQNFPNPFNPTTTIAFAIEKSAMTDIAVYNILGQKISTLVGQQLTPGNYTARWNGTDDHGTQVASGVYFVRMNARTANGAVTFNQIRKLVLMK